MYIPLVKAIVIGIFSCWLGTSTTISQKMPERFKYFGPDICHGIMPKPEGGNLNVNINARNGNVICVIEDDGIGGQLSMHNKAVSTHDSKGMHLTQSRFTLENTLNQNSASIAIIDKHKNGVPAGTIVKFTFKHYKE